MLEYRCAGGPRKGPDLALRRVDAEVSRLVAVGLTSAMEPCLGRWRVAARSSRATGRSCHGSCAVLLAAAFLVLVPRGVLGISLYDVVRLSKAGYADQDIIRRIGVSSQFVLDPDTLVKLRREGVSEKVIRALIEAREPAREFSEEGPPEGRARVGASAFAHGRQPLAPDGRASRANTIGAFVFFPFHARDVVPHGVHRVAAAMAVEGPVALGGDELDVPDATSTVVSGQEGGMSPPSVATTLNEWPCRWIGCESCPTFATRMRTRSPARATNGSVPGKTRLLNVKMSKSVITFGSGREVPGGIAHSLTRIAKSRSIAGSLCFGWMTKKPIVPRPIWTISSVNSYTYVSPGAMSR